MNLVATACPESMTLDPHKRVHYANGLVLGAEDFTQEQFYLLEKSRLHHRALHGYGTVNGLQVRVQDVVGIDGPEIVVEPGLAISPKGQDVCVPLTQCAVLNQWLTRNDELLDGSFGSPPAAGTVPLTLYLVLCPDECKTDRVPIPVGPCHSLDKSSVPSRIADDFRLELRLTAPDQLEEDVVRRFGDLLCSLEITDEPGDFLSLDELLGLVRQLATSGSPPGLGSPPVGSPPVTTTFRLPADQAREMLRAAFRIWVTEVRPALLGDGCAGPTDESCILLGQLDLEIDHVSGIWRVVGDASAIQINEERRPCLLHTRLLQEWMLCGGRSVGVGDLQTFATLSLLDATTVRAWIHHPDLLEDLAPGPVTAAISSSANSAALASITRPDPALNVFDMEFTDELTGGAQVTVRFDAAAIDLQTSPSQDVLSVIDETPYRYLDRDGDIFAAYLGVERLNLGDLSDVSPLASAGNQSPGVSTDDVLTWNGTQWIPSAPAAGVTDHSALSGLAADDHLHYLNRNGARPMTGNLDAGTNLVTNLGENLSDNTSAVRVDRAVKVGDTAGQDLSGNYPDPVVSRIQKRRVSPQQPNPGEILTWLEPSSASGRWAPQPPTIVAATHVHDDNPASPTLGPLPEDGVPFGGLQVFRTTETAGRGIYVMRFDAFTPGSLKPFVIKGTIVTGRPRGSNNVASIGEPPALFEVVHPDAAGSVAPPLPDITQGILIRIVGPNNEPPRIRQFMIEISMFR